MSLCHNYFINNALTLSGLWFQFFTFQQLPEHKNADDYHRQKQDQSGSHAVCFPSRNLTFIGKIPENGRR